MDKTAAAYIRVSTNDQTEYSPDAQLKAIKAYCQNNNLTLNTDHIYIDEGKSGRKAEKRPEFMRMIGNAKLKPAPFSVILVHKFDRFARNRTDSVVYKALLQKECNVKVISITESIENDKFSIIMESMLEAMAEYYSINLSEEVKKGMKEKATRGEPLSIAPFGYKIVDKQLEIYPEQAEIIKEIFEMFIDGHSYLGIAKDINKRGILTNRGNPFENRTIEYVIRNPVYCGYIRWNPTERTRRNYTHPDLMIVKGSHTPIISEDTFNKAQKRADEIKATHRKFYKPQYKVSHWLVSLATCPTCNASLVNSGGYFVCSRYVRGQCPTRNSIKVETLEKLVLAKINNDINSDSFNIEIISPKSETLTSDIQNLTARLENAKIRLQRVKDAYERGYDTIEEYSANKSRIMSEIERCEKEIKIKTPHIANNYKSDFKEALKIAYSVLSSDADNSEKSVVAKKVIKSVDYNKDQKTLDIAYFFNPN